MDEGFQLTKRIWIACTAIASVGLILLTLSGLNIIVMPKDGIIVLAVITVISALYSLWLLIFAISGFVWGIASSLHPIITILVVIFFPLILIPLLIGFYAEEKINES